MEFWDTDTHPSTTPPLHHSTTPPLQHSNTPTSPPFLPMTKPSVLILCTGNSCRSHMAEGILRHAAGDLLTFTAPAPNRPGMVQPAFHRGSQGNRYRYSAHTSKQHPLKQFLDQRIDTVITVCGNADQACPVFPGQVNRHHWGFEDPPKAVRPGESEIEKPTNPPPPSAASATKSASSSRPTLRGGIGKEGGGGRGEVVELWSNGVLECWERDFYEKTKKQESGLPAVGCCLAGCGGIILGSPVTISAQVLLRFGKIRDAAVGVGGFRASKYCRGLLLSLVIREYLHHLNITLGSLGESVFRPIRLLPSRHLTEENFETLDALSYKLEKGLLRLVEALEHKRDEGSWTETLIVEESNAAYGIPEDKERKADGARGVME